MAQAALGRGVVTGGSRTVEMCSSGHSGDGSLVGLGDLKGLFQPTETISDSRTAEAHSCSDATIHPKVLLPHVQASPAFVAAAHQVVLLHSVSEELRPTKGQADFGEELRQEQLPLVSLVAYPC